VGGNNNTEGFCVIVGKENVISGLSTAVQNVVGVVEHELHSVWATDGGE
jgi:hypothetical protein